MNFSLILFFYFKELKKYDLRYKLINTLNKLCTYSSDGYEKAIEIFEIYKVKRKKTKKKQTKTIFLILFISFKI